MVEDIVNESWFWGRLQRTSERGMIPRNYTVDAVSNNLQHLLFFYGINLPEGMCMLGVGKGY